MKIRKFFAGLAAAALAVSTMAISAFAYEPGEAHLTINIAGWGEFEKTETTAMVKEDGTYTVSLTAAEPTGALEQFQALLIEKGEELYGNTYTVTIDKIVIDGKEQELSGSSYTCSSDAGKVETRVNIYNGWNKPSFEADADGYIDCRAKDQANATATLISADYIANGFTTIEVTFTVEGINAAAPAGDTTTTGETPADTTAPTDTTAPADTTAPETGAGAGIALAGIAVAGLMLAVTKRR